jgi:hypothetical protein
VLTEAQKKELTKFQTYLDPNQIIDSKNVKVNKKNKFYDSSKIPSDFHFYEIA